MRKQPVKTWSTPVAAEEKRPVSCTLCGGESFKKALDCEGFCYVRCERCGLVQMNPQPTAAVIARRYREAFGTDYLSYELANEGAFLDLQLLALKDSGFQKIEKQLLESGETPSLLDIGCATGALIFHLWKQGWRVTGVEISPSAEYARRERALDVRGLPLEENHFSSASFDIVLASHLIEHLNDPRSFVREVKRILKNGGRLLVTTPNIAGFQSRLFRSRWRSAIFDHLYLFSVKTLKALLVDAGFRIEGVYTWGGLAAGIAPGWLKKAADSAVKPLGMGDVMLIRALNFPSTIPR